MKFVSVLSTVFAWALVHYCLALGLKIYCDLIAISFFKALIMSDIIYKCPVEYCEKTFLSSADIIAHLKTHIKYGHKIKCPYVLCEKSYNYVSSFSSHISRVHRQSMHAPLLHKLEESCEEQHLFLPM